MTYLFTTATDAKVFTCPACEHGCERCFRGEIVLDSAHGLEDALSMGLTMPWEVAVEWGLRDGYGLNEIYSLCNQHGITRPKVAAE